MLHDQSVIFGRLKLGQCFTLTRLDPRVWVRSRGGFRLGTGGPLMDPRKYGMDRNSAVLFYDPAHAIPR